MVNCYMYSFIHSDGHSESRDDSGNPTMWEYTLEETQGQFRVANPAGEMMMCLK